MFQALRTMLSSEVLNTNPRGNILSWKTAFDSDNGNALKPEDVKADVKTAKSGTPRVAS